MRTVIACCVVLLACGGGDDDDDGGSTPPPPPPPSGFAGTYATAVTLTSTTCGPVTVQSLPTTVTHNQSAGVVSLTHGGATYAGSVAADSTFTTTPLEQDVGDGFLYRVMLTGRFGARSFVADATVDRSGGSSSACRYVAHWAGTR